MVITGILRRQAFKEELLYVNAVLHRDFLKMSPNGDVILGRDGWFFYKGRQDPLEDPLADYAGTNLFTEEELARIAGNMTRSQEKAAQAGAVFIVVLAPNKERIYPEYLPEGYGMPAENARIRQVADYLRAHTSVPVIDMTPVLSTYRDVHPEERLYIRHDTHWNFQGSYLAANEILSYLGDPLPPLSALNRVEVDAPVGDLSILMGFGENYKGETEEYLTEFTDHYATETLSTTYEHAYVNDAETPHRSLLVAGDSFSVSLMPYLASHFGRAYMNFHYNYDEQMIAEHQPDVIVYEVLERFLSYMLTFEL